MAEASQHHAWVHRAKARYYQVHLDRDLFGDWTLRKVWGGIDSSRGRMHNTAVPSYDDGVEQIIEYYAVRWKIEAGFREIKQEIGSAHTQTRNPDAVTNHLHFCMAATTITWIYAAHLNQAPILSVLIEQMVDLPMLDKLADAYSEAQEEYMPSGPPMSPLTTSYFTCWGSFDLCSSGAKKETLCTIATDFCRFQQVDEGLITLFEAMQTSRMGVYRHEDVSNRFVLLRELVTNNEIKAISASGYLGNAGEVWFARVPPPPFETAAFDYSLVFTTPCVLGKLGPRREFVSFVEEDWLAYFKRNLPKTNKATDMSAYDHLMKYGLSRNYWNEYIFLSYRNHRQDMILLEGIPDILARLPHTNEGRIKSGVITWTC